LSAQPAKCRKVSAASGMSTIRGSPSGFPTSMASSAARFAVSRSISSATRHNSLPRSAPLRRAHGPSSNWRRADMTASSTSRSDADRKSAITDSVAESTTGNVSPSCDSRHSPPTSPAMAIEPQAGSHHRSAWGSFVIRIDMSEPYHGRTDTNCPRTPARSAGLGARSVGAST
jgi:hypothetical protein